MDGALVTDTMTLVLMTRNSVSSLWRSGVGDRNRERVMVNASTVLTVTLLEVLST